MRVTVLGVCVCVCVSVKSHLNFGVSVSPENTVTYSMGNGVLYRCILLVSFGTTGRDTHSGVFSENALFKSYSVICHAVASYRADVQFSTKEPSKVL